VHIHENFENYGVLETVAVKFVHYCYHSSNWNLGDFSNQGCMFFFFIKSKNWIDQKTSWRPAVHIYKQTQAKGTDSLEPNCKQDKLDGLWLGLWKLFKAWACSWRSSLKEGKVGQSLCNNPAFQAQNNSKFFFYIYIYLTHMVPVISEPDPSYHQNTIHTIHISFKSESYINT